MKIKVILSAAISLDGYLDDLSPARLKLSSQEDWAEVQRLRAGCDAILVGAETVRKDNPSLVIRDKELRENRVAAGMNPDIVKVTISRSGNLDPNSNFFTQGAGKKIVFTSGQVSPQLEAVADIIFSPCITAGMILSELSVLGCRTLMVEGGGSILDMFLTEGIVDEFRLAIAPFFVGQEGAPRLVNPSPFIWNKDNRMKVSAVELLGDTSVLHLKPRLGCDEKYMRMALDASRNCRPCSTSYCVGAVIVTRSGEVFTGYTHETGSANHAEEEAVLKALANGADLRGGTIYSTMEPCSSRSSKPISCSRLIIDRGFKRVVYALAEPLCFVDCQGDSILRNAGIEVDTLDQFAPEVISINSHIIQ